MRSGGEEYGSERMRPQGQSKRDYKLRVPKVRQWSCRVGREKRTRMEGFLNGLLRGLRRVFEKPQLAMEDMIVAVVLALIKARTEDKD